MAFCGLIVVVTNGDAATVTDSTSGTGGALVLIGGSLVVALVGAQYALLPLVNHYVGYVTRYPSASAKLLYAGMIFCMLVLYVVNVYAFGGALFGGGGAVGDANESSTGVTSLRKTDEEEPLVQGDGSALPATASSVVNMITSLSSFDSQTAS